MENKPRILTICSSRTGYAQVIAGGAWFQEFGFSLGEQVTLTNPKKGTLVMEVTKSAHDWYSEKKKKRLISRAKAVKKELENAFWESEKNKALAEQHEIEIELAELDQAIQQRA